MVRTIYIIRELGIRYVRYADYRVALVGETTIRFLSNLVQESIVCYPEFTQRLILAWHDLGGSFHSQSPALTHLSYLQTPFFTPHQISPCSELFQLSLCYS